MLPRKIHLKFFSKPGTLAMLESYANPSSDLDIKFRKVVEEYDDSYYEAIVSERSTSKPRLVINFKLSKNDKEIDVGNIEPVLDTDEKGKTVHTSSGSFDGGVDLGTRGVHWLMKQLKNFAKAQGFSVERITSSTRYTGARAFNNLGNDEFDMPKTFKVNKNLKEIAVYESNRGTTTYYLIEER